MPGLPLSEDRNGLRLVLCSPSMILPITSARSWRVPMDEPMMDRCLPKMKRLSISNFGPPVLPTVRMRPPFARRAKAEREGGAYIVHHHVHAAFLAQF